MSLKILGAPKPIDKFPDWYSVSRFFDQAIRKKPESFVGLTGLKDPQEETIKDRKIRNNNFIGRVAEDRASLFWPDHHLERS
jgi:hypothetical protein